MLRLRTSPGAARFGAATRRCARTATALDFRALKLLHRFAVLLALIGLSVLLSLGFAAWSVQTISQEVSSAYSDLTFVLEQLDRIKQTFEHDIAAIHAANASPQEAFERLPIDRQIDPVMKELAARPGYRRRAGESTSAMLTELVRQCKEEMEAYQSATIAARGLTIDHPQRERAQQRFESVHTLIERIQAQLLRDVELSLDYGRDLRVILLRIVSACLLITLMTGVLALILVRRWVLRPIAELRRATEEIAAGNFGYRLAIRSGDEFGQLSGEVNHMAEMVVAAQRRLVERERLAAVGELVRRLAHNLRNPLAGIRSLAEISRGELPADSDLRENQDRIVNAVDRFERWLSDLLHSTSPLSLKRESVRTDELIHSLEASHAPMARGKRIRLEIETDSLPDRLEADPVQMEHALVALLSNAIEAAPEGGVVRFRASRTQARRGEEEIEFRVEDSGPGVDPSVLDKVFLPHFTTKRHGTGIGLAVAHNVVAAHGGRIRIERSSDLGGAAFIVTLPLAGG